MYRVAARSVWIRTNVSEFENASGLSAFRHSVERTASEFFIPGVENILGSAGFSSANCRNDSRCGRIKSGRKFFIDDSNHLFLLRLLFAAPRLLPSRA